MFEDVAVGLIVTVVGGLIIWYLSRVESAIKSTVTQEADMADLKDDVRRVEGRVDRIEEEFGRKLTLIGREVSSISGKLSVLLTRRRSDRELKEYGDGNVE